MTRAFVPDEILDLAHARAQARERRDWDEADRLRAAIEAAGWRIADRGTDFALTPATPPDLDEGKRIRYGASRNVPSRLDDAPTGLATVIVIATDWPDDLARARSGLRESAPEGTSVVIVADAPSDAQAAALDGLAVTASDTETRDRLDERAAGPGRGHQCRHPPGELGRSSSSSTQASSHRATSSRRWSRPSATPTVGVAGPWGLVTADLRKFDDAPSGDVDAIGGYLLAFRRSDFTDRGPLDERFRFYRNLDIWWSLVLRDEGEGNPPRRAVSVGGLPLVRHEHRGWTSLPDEERDRQSKRNFYRIIDRFGSRQDLVVRRD